jgi:hypothetical protein
MILGWEIKDIASGVQVGRFGAPERWIIASLSQSTDGERWTLVSLLSGVATGPETAENLRRKLNACELIPASIIDHPCYTGRTV